MNSLDFTSVLGLSRETEPTGDTEIYMHTDTHTWRGQVENKTLAHMIMEADKSQGKIYRVSQQVGHPGESIVESLSKGWQA